MPVYSALTTLETREAAEALAGALENQEPEPSGVGVFEIEDAADGTRSGLVDVEATELPNDPVERLRRMIDQRQAESLEILRGWLDRGEETA